MRGATCEGTALPNIPAAEHSFQANISSAPILAEFSCSQADGPTGVQLRAGDDGVHGKRECSVLPTLAADTASRVDHFRDSKQEPRIVGAGGRGTCKADAPLKKAVNRNSVLDVTAPSSSCVSTAGTESAGLWPRIYPCTTVRSSSPPKLPGGNTAYISTQVSVSYSPIGGG